MVVPGLPFHLPGTDRLDLNKTLKNSLAGATMVEVVSLVPCWTASGATGVRHWWACHCMETTRQNGRRRKEGTHGAFEPLEG